MWCELPMTSDKTLWERIAEWRKPGSDPCKAGREGGMAWVADNTAAQCANELAPIAEALEAVVRDVPHQWINEEHCRKYECVRCRLERIVGSK
jgi:hypothetical protein